jgi:hypothetical protein
MSVVREDQKRAKIERERRESLKEEEEEKEEDDKGEGTSSGTKRRRIMRRKPVSTVKAEAESQVADDFTQARPKEDGNTAVEEHDADNQVSDDGEQENREPVGSGDYGSIFGPSEDETEEGEVNQLTDAHADSETEEEMDAQEVDQQLIAPSKSESTASSSRTK